MNMPTEAITNDTTEPLVDEVVAKWLAALLASDERCGTDTPPVAEPRRGRETAVA
jgi:hypothetical protein